MCNGNEALVRSCNTRQFITACTRRVIRADPADPSRITDETRGLGLIVCRGPNITVLAPDDGMVEIENPFLQAEGEEGDAS